jgi:hypothetical protein
LLEPYHTLAKQAQLYHYFRDYNIISESADKDTRENVLKSSEQNLLEILKSLDPNFSYAEIQLGEIALCE